MKSSFGKAQVAPRPRPPRSGGFLSFFSQDARRHGRARMMLPGKIWSGLRIPVVECLIGDISAGGARVRVKRGTNVPAQLTLVHVRERTAYRAYVVWRRPDGSLGLAFRKSFNLDGAMAPELMAIRDCCLPPR